MALFYPQNKTDHLQTQDCKYNYYNLCNTTTQFCAVYLLHHTVFNVKYLFSSLSGTCICVFF